MGNIDLMNMISILKKETYPLQDFEDNEPISINETFKEVVKQWDEAKNFFDQVFDKDLVDEAIYRMDAAERKYVYLLKLAKKEGIVNTEVKKGCNCKGV